MRLTVNIENSIFLSIPFYFFRFLPVRARTHTHIRHSRETRSTSYRKFEATLYTRAWYLARTRRQAGFMKKKKKKKRKRKSNLLTGVFFDRFAATMFNAASPAISQPFGTAPGRKPDRLVASGGSNFIRFSPIDSILNLEDSRGSTLHLSRYDDRRHRRRRRLSSSPHGFFRSSAV